MVIVALYLVVEIAAGTVGVKQGFIVLGRDVRVPVGGAALELDVKGLAILVVADTPDAGGVEGGPHGSLEGEEAVGWDGGAFEPTALLLRHTL